MSFFSTLRTAAIATRTNTLRSALTSLGIAIAVSAVMMMVAVGDGAQQEIDEGIASLGANVFHIYSGENKVGVRSDGAGSRPSFTEDDLHAILQVEGVRAGSGSLRSTARIVSQEANWQSNIEGVHADFLIVRDWGIAKGRNFSELEERTGQKVAIVGATVAEKLFGANNPLGQSVRIGKAPFTVVGILGKKGQSASGHDDDDVVLVPLKAARSYLTMSRKIQLLDAGNLVVKIKKGSSTTAARLEIESLLRVRRKIQSDADDDFLVRDLTEFLNTRAAAQKTLGLLLAATAAITLLVGGIGIMNVMLVSVSERTKEIGLRLALGARQTDIMSQFLAEALVLCALGCALGVTLGYAGTLGLNEALDWDVESSTAIAFIAVAAAMVTAIVFGFVPAYRAAHLSPLQALSKE